MEVTYLNKVISRKEKRDYKCVDILSYRVFSDTLSNLDFDRPAILNTINPHSFCVAKTDPAFRKALLQSDVLLPDGVGIVWAQRFLRGERIAKISGMDLFMHILEYAERQNDPSRKRIFFMGSSENTLKRIQAKINRHYPSLVVEYLSPPFKPSFTESENEIIVEEIHAFQPYFLFVGMTAPKQEKWVFVNKPKLKVPVISSIGAVFDFYAETVRRPSPVWVELGLEWLIRFLNEPRRLWRRVLISAPKFVSAVLQTKLQSY